MFAKKERTVDENENAVAVDDIPAPITTEPIIPEIMPDEPTQPAPLASAGAIIPMSEWNKLYQGHIEFKTAYVGVEASIADRQTTVLGKLKRYDEMLEKMDTTVGSEIDRLEQFKKERFGS